MDEGHDSFEDDYLFFPSTILEGKLYLSCASIAANQELIEKYNIKGIISMGGFEAHTTYKIHPEVDYHFVFISDYESEPIHLEFAACFDFINNTEGAVLVHCMAGISRSATIVIAYLMKEKQMGFQEAYAYVKKKRSIVFPNSGFRHQLREFELQLNLK
jgi:protein tyrosine phosphatase